MKTEINLDLDFTLEHILAFLILLLGTVISLTNKDSSVFIASLTTAGLVGGWAGHKQNEYYRENKETLDA